MSNEGYDTDEAVSYAAGAGSVLDFSGDSSVFGQLSRRKDKRKSDGQAIAGDFEAIGSDLEQAIQAHFTSLPRKKKVAVIRRLFESRQNG